MDEKERSRALEQTLGQIEKQFGKGSIVRLGSKEAIVPIAVISSGAISIDSALGTADFRADGFARYSDRNRPVRPPFRCR